MEIDLGDLNAFLAVARAKGFREGYLDRCGRPQHPRDLLSHACLRGRFASGAMTPWEFERDGEVVRVDSSGPLLVQVGAATDLAVEAAIADVDEVNRPPAQK